MYYSLPPGAFYDLLDLNPNQLDLDSDSRCLDLDMRCLYSHITNIWQESRGVETVGPVSPVGHGHLRSDSSPVLSDQMSERTPEYLKCYLDDILACIAPTVKYDL